ncbi:MAG: RNA methyltransferase [Chitinophagales bacterium]
MRKLNMEELNRLTVEEYKSSWRIPVIVVLDNVRSGHNAGSVFRTCDAFGVTALYVCGITPFPPNREVMKTALGSNESVDWIHFVDTGTALRELKDRGFQIIFAEHTTESIALQQFIFSKDKKYALVFGNEVEGIKSELLPLADQVIEIPQFGTKHSLNISVAAGIVLWDIWNKVK